VIFFKLNWIFLFQKIKKEILIIFSFIDADLKKQIHINPLLNVTLEEYIALFSVMTLFSQIENL
jgi:hypothetical protein